MGEIGILCQLYFKNYICKYATGNFSFGNNFLFHIGVGRRLLAARMLLATVYMAIASSFLFRPSLISICHIFILFEPIFKNKMLFLSPPDLYQFGDK